MPNANPYTEGLFMNTNKVQEYFTENVPALNFLLAGQPVLTVNVATINMAKKLATGLQDYVHPDVLKFLEVVAYTSEDELEQSIKNIVESKGFARFCFYLTVFSGRLQVMLETHAIQYLPTIDIPLETVVDIEYYPCIQDDHLIANNYDAIFGGDISKLLLYCNSMKDNYIRVNLIAGYRDISAVDILGYVEKIT